MTKTRTDHVIQGVAQRARGELAQAAGNNTLVSKKEQGALANDLKAAAELARTQKGPSARVSVDDIAAVYESVAKERIAEVNLKGPTWVSNAEEQAIGDPALRQRVVDVRIALKTGTLSLDELARRAKDFVAENVAPVAGEWTEKPFPAVDSGERGLSGHLLVGAEATRLATFVGYWNSPYVSTPTLGDVDPNVHGLLVVRTSGYDNERLVVSRFHRATGAFDPSFEIDTGSVFFRIPEADFVSLVRPVSSFGSDRYEFGAFPYEKVSDVLLNGARTVAIENPLASVDDATVAALHADAEAAAGAAGMPGLALHFSPTVAAAMLALPNNTVSFADAVEGALRSFLVDDADPDSPLSILRERVMEERGETTPSASTLAEARTRLEAFLRAPETTWRLQTFEERPEGGPAPTEAWVFQLDVPTLSGTVHYALVDRAGLLPTRNYGFN